jgi:hypothetical protein
MDQPQRCKWALTPAGAAKAKTLCGPSKPVNKGAQAAPNQSKENTGGSTRNATSRWLEKHLAKGTNSDLYRMMWAYLSRKLSLSAKTSMIDDHIQTFLLRLIHRDSLAKHLAGGQKVPYTKVVAYLGNSGRSDIRDMAQNPVCRELYGARSKRERADRSTSKKGMVSVSHDTDGNVVVSEEATIPQDPFDFEGIWSRIEDVVKQRKPAIWQQYVRILALKTQGYTIKEIATTLEVDPNRATSLLADARRCVREGYKRGQFKGLVSLRN